MNGDSNNMSENLENCQDAMNKLINEASILSFSPNQPPLVNTENPTAAPLVGSFQNYDGEFMYDENLYCSADFEVFVFNVEKCLILLPQDMNIKLLLDTPKILCFVKNSWKRLITVALVQQEFLLECIRLTLMLLFLIAPSQITQIV